jgi:hypothetical protein
MASAAVVNQVSAARTAALDRLAGVLGTMEVCRNPTVAAIVQDHDSGDAPRHPAHCPICGNLTGAFLVRQEKTLVRTSDA